MLGVDLCNNACGNAGLLDWLMSQAYGLRHSDLCHNALAKGSEEASGSSWAALMCINMAYT